MKMYILFLCGTVAAFGAASPILAQEETPIMERPAEYRDEALVYLAQKDAELAENDAALKRLGMGQNIIPLYNILKDKGRFQNRNVIGDNAEKRGRVVDALTMTAAQFLAAGGISPSELVRLDKVGFDVAKSVEQVITGAASIEDAIVVSDVPILGTITSSNQSSDLLNYDVTISVDRSLKPQKKVPGTLSFRVMASNSTSGLPTGTQCVFFLSDNYKAFKSALNLDLGGSNFTPQILPFCSTDGTFQSLAVTGLNRPATMNDIEAVAAKLQK